MPSATPKKVRSAPSTLAYALEVPVSSRLQSRLNTSAEAADCALRRPDTAEGHTIGTRALRDDTMK